jgi:hypothetical protein
MIRRRSRSENVAKIFLSYRRDDSRADAGRLYDRLSARFGAETVFMDIDDIVAGENFVEKLKDTLSRCSTLLVVIGPHWLDVADESGRRRLWSPDDYVRLEIASGLERGITLIPVLVGGAHMPARADLPPDIADLALHQAIAIADDRFHEDVDRLARVISQAHRGASRASRRRLAVAAAALVVGALVAGAGWLAHVQRGAPQLELRSSPDEVSAAQARAMLAVRGFYERAVNASGAGVAHEYVTQVAGDEVLVLDRSTGLLWQKGGSAAPVSYAQAVDYVRALNDAGLAGATDWRLPTLEEAMSLMEARAVGSYHLDPVFERLAAPYVWTSDAAGERQWVVYYLDGVAAMEPPNLGGYARAVRTAR